MSKSKTFRVCFTVLDGYLIELKARNQDAAIQKAMDLYERNGTGPFYLDYTSGGTDGWDAEEVVS